MNHQKIFSTPELWPTWPYLRIERRTQSRAGQMTCVLVSNELHEVESVVYLCDAWPPDGNGLPEPRVAIEYDSIDVLARDRWRPFSLL